MKSFAVTIIDPRKDFSQNVDTRFMSQVFYRAVFPSK